MNNTREPTLRKLTLSNHLHNYFKKNISSPEFIFYSMQLAQKMMNQTSASYSDIYYFFTEFEVTDELEPFTKTPEYKKYKAAMVLK